MNKWSLKSNFDPAEYNRISLKPLYIQILTLYLMHSRSLARTHIHTQLLKKKETLIMHIITLFYLTSVKSDSSVNRTFSSSTFYAGVTFPGVQLFSALSLFWWQKYTTRDSNWGQHMQKGLLKWTKPSTLSYNYDF